MNVVDFLPGILIGLGLTALVAAVIPVRPDLRAALDHIGATDVTPTGDHVSRQDRIGSWVQARLPDLPGFTLPVKDLALIGTSPAKFVWEKTLLAVFGLFAPLLFGVLMQAFGYLPAYLPALVGLPLAIALWFAPDRELKSKAAAARDEFARAVAIYLELVAAERRRGAPAAHALASAAEVGSTWVFARIREELTRARLAGTSPWNALNGLAEQIDVPELADVAKITRLSGEEGASVYETLRGRGRTLRVQLLNGEHAKANAASERMSVPLTFLAFVFVGIILTPLVMDLIA